MTFVSMLKAEKGLMGNGGRGISVGQKGLGKEVKKETECHQIDMLSCCIESEGLCIALDD